MRTKKYVGLNYMSGIRTKKYVGLNYMSGIRTKKYVGLNFARSVGPRKRRTAWTLGIDAEVREGSVHNLYNLAPSAGHARGARAP